MSALCLPSVTNSLTRRRTPYTLERVIQGTSRHLVTMNVIGEKYSFTPPADILVSLLVMCCGWVEQDNSLALVTFDAHALLLESRILHKAQQCKRSLKRPSKSPTDRADGLCVCEYMTTFTFVPAIQGGRVPFLALKFAKANAKPWFSYTGYWTTAFWNNSTPGRDTSPITNFHGNERNEREDDRLHSSQIYEQTQSYQLIREVIIFPIQ